MTPAEQLLTEIAQLILTRLQDQPPFPTDSPYLDVVEAARYCRVTRKTIYNHRAEIERCPGIGKLVFTREALDKWLQTRRRRRK